MQNGAERLAQKIGKGSFAVGFAVTLAEPALSEMAAAPDMILCLWTSEHSPLDPKGCFSAHYGGSGRRRGCSGAGARRRACGCSTPILDMGR